MDTTVKYFESITYVHKKPKLYLCYLFSEICVIFSTPTEQLTEGKFYSDSHDSGTCQPIIAGRAWHLMHDVGLVHLIVISKGRKLHWAIFQNLPLVMCLHQPDLPTRSSAAFRIVSQATYQHLNIRYFKFKP